MSIGRAQLEGFAHAERQRLGRTIQYAAPEIWEQPSTLPGWWNRDLMAHLAGQDTAAAQLMKGDPAEELDAYRATLDGQELTTDGLNTFLVNNRSGLPYRDVLAAWGQAAQAFLAYAAVLDDRDWTDRRFEWLSGAIAAKYLVQSRVVEWWVHGEDLRAAADLGPGFQHWPIHLTIDLGVRMLPWALGRAGHDLSGRSVEIRLGGAGEGAWLWGLGAGETPAPDAHPDAVIEGRAPQFALVAARRLSADDVLEAGTVVVGGNRAIAEMVVREIRAFV